MKLANLLFHTCSACLYSLTLAYVYLIMYNPEERGQNMVTFTCWNFVNLISWLLKFPKFS